MDYVSVPAEMALQLLLAKDEHIECRNATVVCKDNGEFSFWIDNEKLIPISCEHQE